MTREEAANIIKSECYACNLFNLDWTTKVNTALDVAVESLEKEPCEDTISRKAVFETIDDCNKDGSKGIFCSYDDGERFKKYIKNLPPVTPTKCIATIKFSKEDMRELVNEKMKDIVVERKKGKWVNIHDKDEWYGDQFRCSLCDNITIDNGLYCPHCGAEMENEE